jgi:hypothetical protein
VEVLEVVVLIIMAQEFRLQILGEIGIIIMEVIHLKMEEMEENQHIQVLLMVGLVEVVQHLVGQVVEEVVAILVVVVAMDMVLVVAVDLIV